MMLGDIAMAVLAMAGLAIAAASIAAAVSAHGAKHEIQNGTTDTLGRIEERLIGQDRRLERVESKVDRAHARINDINQQMQQHRREQGS